MPTPMIHRSKTSLKWQVSPHDVPEVALTEWMPAVVPGAVQLDWAKAYNWPPLEFGENHKAYDGLEDRFWTYRATINHLASPGRRLFFVCGGIDYAYEIFLDGRPVLLREGMFTPIELDLTDAVRFGSELTVRVHPAPKSFPDTERKNRDQANRSCKPAVSYGWDFHPRVIPLGIWQDAFLEDRPAVHLHDVDVTASVSDDLQHGVFHCHPGINGSIDGHSLRCTLRGPNGDVLDVEQQPAQDGQLVTGGVNRPPLWWPHDQGEPKLCTVDVDLLDASGTVIDTYQRRIGFRRVRLVMNHNAWIEPAGFPKGRSTAPIQLEINNRNVFGKGANLVGPDIFPGRVTDEHYEQLVNLIKRSNMNLVRMWGGAAVQKRAFFDACDEAGVMIWQEFPLACNNYPDDAAYLAVLDQESRSIIHALAPHASVVLWCGGNELFNSWSGMTDQSLALRLLNRNCFDLDPHRPFLPTSPVYGMGHGHYTFRDPTDGVESWSLFQQSSCTAYTEFGMPGPADVETLRTIIPDDEWFPLRPGTAWESHHAFKAWQDNAWLGLDNLEHYFGPLDSVEAVVARGQLLQSEGYKGLFEEARRQKPVASMTLNWVLNEPWPTAANNSLVSWPLKPKPALAAVAGSLRPVLASAKISHYLWRENDWFDPELWLLSDSPDELRAGRIEAFLVGGGKEIFLLGWDHPALPANTNLRGPRIGFKLPNLGDTGKMTLDVRIMGYPARNSTYVLAYRPTKTVAQSATRTMNL